jgi:hypothetical protein
MPSGLETEKAGFYETPVNFYQTVMCHILEESNPQVIFCLINALKPSGSICTIRFNVRELCILLTECICVLSMVLAINSHCFLK